MNNQLNRTPKKISLTCDCGRENVDLDTSSVLLVESLRENDLPGVLAYLFACVGCGAGYRRAINRAWALGLSGVAVRRSGRRDKWPTPLSSLVVEPVPVRPAPLSRLARIFGRQRQGGVA